MAYRDKAARNARLRAMYGERMAALKKALWGVCALCSAGEPLHIDHMNGRPYVARRLSSNQRLVRYEIEAKEGKLRLLCEKCNCSSKNHPPGCTCGRSPNQPHPEPAPAPALEPIQDF